MSKDILRATFGWANQIKTDYKLAEQMFEQGLKDIPVLTRPPYPAELITSFGDEVRELTTRDATKFFSFPTTKEYRYTRTGLTVNEARRTYTTRPHTSFHDQVVGLHFINQRNSNESEGIYYWAITHFPADTDPFSLLTKAQFDSSLDPLAVINYYQQITPWNRFHHDQIPATLAGKVIHVMQKIELL